MIERPMDYLNEFDDSRSHFESQIYMGWERFDEIRYNVIFRELDSLILNKDDHLSLLVIISDLRTEYYQLTGETFWMYNGSLPDEARRNVLQGHLDYLLKNIPMSLEIKARELINRIDKHYS